MKLEELSVDLHQAFVDNAWEFEGYGVPTQEDVQTFLETCRMHLEDKPEGTALTVGNMSIRKDAKDYQVYVLMGKFEVDE